MTVLHKFESFSTNSLEWRLFDDVICVRRKMIWQGKKNDELIGLNKQRTYMQEH